MTRTIVHLYVSTYFDFGLLRLSGAELRLTRVRDANTRLSVELPAVVCSYSPRPRERFAPTHAGLNVASRFPGLSCVAAHLVQVSALH